MGLRAELSCCAQLPQSTAVVEVGKKSLYFLHTLNIACFHALV